MPLDRRHFLAGAAGASGPLLAAGGLLSATHRAQASDDDPAQRRPWPEGKPTPALALPGWDGPTWNLADARGQVVVLNFWASWCEPCLSELPSLELLASRHAAHKLQVVCVNYRETDGALRRFLQAQPLSLPIVRDRDGGTSKAWGARIFPTTVVVDRTGRAVFSVIGEVDWAGALARSWLAPVLT
ncbi:MAG: TlpA family protein disulfide reductase [Burkholderiales bacterium]|nr:TlpA family protein disulfide reductase [Burkholderiales bacterium]